MPAPTAQGVESLAASSEAGSSIEDIEADKLALSTLAMHLPVGEIAMLLGATVASHVALCTSAYSPHTL